MTRAPTMPRLPWDLAPAALAEHVAAEATAPLSPAEQRLLPSVMLETVKPALRPAKQPARKGPVDEQQFLIAAVLSLSDELAETRAQLARVVGRVAALEMRVPITARTKAVRR